MGIAGKVKYWAYVVWYVVLIPYTITRYYLGLLFPKPVTRVLRDARFCSNGHVSGKSALQDGTVTDACGFLLDLRVEKGEMVAILDGYRYVIANVVPSGDKQLHETLCELWLPGPEK
ncbi:hypothetical protein NP572_19475 [Pseudomonas putida]|uniref:hypothetical protein n=1 Tax=Pseudomonas putida TaxID=303 RepID=UPI002364A583|nr:hypothetical protein [Pseudomonas putida]MDD2038756.1 hypothetical protein [Pseudomonas putida]MDD2044299.1 hypothetical protein [Pseudomonas putida]